MLANYADEDEAVRAALAVLRDLDPDKYQEIRRKLTEDIERARLRSSSA